MLSQMHILHFYFVGQRERFDYQTKSYVNIGICNKITNLHGLTSNKHTLICLVYKKYNPNIGVEIGAQ